MTKGKRQARIKRAKRTRMKIRQLRMPRLAVFRSPRHIYAQLIDALGKQVIASASTLDKTLRNAGNTGNIAAASQVGQLIAERAKSAGVSLVAFDRSGFRYHGRVKALAEAARAHGLQF